MIATTRIAVLISLVLATGLGSEAQAANRYVSPSGSNILLTSLNHCLYPTFPCRDVVQAMRHAPPGDVIRVAAGVYQGPRLKVAPVGYSCAGCRSAIPTDRRVTIEGGWTQNFSSRQGGTTSFATRTEFEVMGNRALEVTFDQISFDTGSAWPIDADARDSGRVSVTLRGCDVTSSDEIRLVLWEGSDGTLRVRDSVVSGGIYLQSFRANGFLDLASSELRPNQNGSAVSVSSYDGSSVVTDVDSSSVQGDLRFTSWESSAHLEGHIRENDLDGTLTFHSYGGSINADVEANDIHGGGIRVTADADGSQRVSALIHRNQIDGENTNHTGILIRDFSGDSLLDVRTQSNMIFGHRRGIIARGARGGQSNQLGSRLYAMHDTISENGIGLIADSPFLVYAAKSILWGNTNLDLRVDAGTPRTLIASSDVGTVTGLPLLWNRMNANPQFVSPTGDNFHLRPTSPLLGTVYCTGWKDFDGEQRPKSGNCDPGADEVLSFPVSGPYVPLPGTTPGATP